MSYNMLIAEDERNEYELVLYLLDKLNLTNTFQIFHAANGKQAMQILSEAPIDVLLTDIEMPFVNGLELAQKSRECNQDMPIIFFSCYDNFSYAKTALSVGACNYMLKPLDPHEFEKTMSDTITLLRQNETDKKQQLNNRETLQNHYLYLKLNGMPMPGEAFFQSSLNLSFIKEYKQLLLINFDQPFFDCDNLTTDDLVEQMHRFFPGDFDYLNIDSTQSVLLFKQVFSNEKQLSEMCNTFANYVSLHHHQTCYIAVSCPIAENYGLADAYEDALNLLESRLFTPGKTLFFKECAGTETVKNPEELSGLLQRIES
ncbi:MAG: response regulator, partial [Acetatifactor sp.]|nr:response regulator [Acetatifactor sp.]